MSVPTVRPQTDDIPVRRAGALDTRYATLGRTAAAYPHFGGVRPESLAYASALDLRGRLVIAGHSFDADAHLVTTLLRLRQDGTLDTGFGVHGFVTLPAVIDTGSTWLRRVVAFPDGSLIIGFDVKGAHARHVMLRRLQPDGSVDLGFMKHGEGAARFVASSRIDTLHGMVSTAQGGVLLLASVHPDGLRRETLALLRLDAQGRPDAGFGHHGARLVPAPHGWSRRRPWQLGTTPDGSVVIGGELIADAGGTDATFGVMRLHADARADTGFGQNGLAQLVCRPGDALRVLLVRDDGRVVLVVQTGDPARTENADDPAGSAISVLQCTADGRPDVDFGDAGEMHTGLGVPTRSQRAQVAQLQSDGRLLLAGTPWAARAGQRVAVTRLLPDGRRDTTFGDNGFVLAGFGTASEQRLSVNVDSIVGLHPAGDRILVAGHLLECEMKYKFCALALQC